MTFKASRTAKAGTIVASMLLAGVTLLNALPASAVDFSNPAFQRVWDRTDSLVAQGLVSRTWFWGPEPRAAAQEQYVDAPDGTQTRLVQYFDKSRMEINNPAGDPNTTFFVTNGLLTIELISGQMQIGNNAFIERYPANIPFRATRTTQTPPRTSRSNRSPIRARATTRSPTVLASLQPTPLTNPGRWAMTPPRLP